MADSESPRACVCDLQRLSKLQPVERLQLEVTLLRIGALGLARCALREVSNNPTPESSALIERLVRAGAEVRRETVVELDEHSARCVLRFRYFENEIEQCVDLGSFRVEYPVQTPRGFP